MRFLIFALLSLAYAQSESPQPSRSSLQTRTPTSSSSVTTSSRPSNTQTASSSETRSSRPSYTSTQSPLSSYTNTASARFTVSASSRPTLSLSPSYTTTISSSVTSSITKSPTPTPSVRCIEEWSRPLLSVFGTNTDFCVYNTVIHNQRTAAVAACFAIAFTYCIYLGCVAEATCCDRPYERRRRDRGTPTEQTINCIAWSTCTWPLIPISHLLYLMYRGLRYVVLKLYIRGRSMAITIAALTKAPAKEIPSTNCGICLEDYTEPADPTNPDGYLKACGHRFHTKCMEPWLKQSPMCPLCRAPIPISV